MVSSRSNMLAGCLLSQYILKRSRLRYIDHSFLDYWQYFKGGTDTKQLVGTCI